MDLVAYSPEDGWAFVRQGESLMLFRPPYRGNRLTVKNEDVERAVTDHGYLVSDRVFNTERELIRYLYDEVAQSFPATTTNDELRKELLELADAEEIDFYISEASAWIGEGRTLDADLLLDRLITARALTLEHRRRIGELKEALRSYEAARDVKASGGRSAPLAARFARASSSGRQGNVGDGLLRPVD